MKTSVRFMSTAYAACRMRPKAHPKNKICMTSTILRRDFPINPNASLGANRGFRADSSSCETKIGFEEAIVEEIPKTDLITSPRNQADFSRLPETMSNLENATNSLQPLIRSNSTHAVENVYEVRAGDSFWTIAQFRYGDGQFFRALYLYNQRNLAGFDDLKPGTKIDTPSETVLRQLWPDYCPATESPASVPVDSNGQASYITRDGDTLFEIAAQRLGQASRYLEILELNAHRLPASVNHLTPLAGGIEIVLPASGSN